VAGQDHDLPYRVEVWDRHDTRVDDLIALVGDHAVARAAFEEAIRRRPGRIVMLRQKSRVLAESGKGSAMIRSEYDEDQEDR
jgi:hypothetical protein